MSGTSSSVAPFASVRDDASRHWFLGSEAWVRLGTEASGGALAVVEHRIPPGAESPWHVHLTQDECLYVVEGTVTVMVGSQRWTLGPGGFTFGPRNVPHGFRVEGDRPARLLLICTPGEGFDEFIIAGGEPATAPGFPAPAPPDIAKLTWLAGQHGNQILGPLPA
ncbi:MAG: cupin domain-containing protein [Candidatus Dormibacteraeota bacterium]|nr:cupin domain-containing protein [Candidatus Dormibacteraeota bacterium]